MSSDEEWTFLEDYLTSHGSEGIEGTALKAISGWANNGNGTDDFGFSAKPGGRRMVMGSEFWDGGITGWWWTSNDTGNMYWNRAIFDINNGVYRFAQDYRNGYSVRCVRD